MERPPRTDTTTDAGHPVAAKVAGWLVGQLGTIGYCIVVAIVLTGIMLPFWAVAREQIVQSLLVNTVISLGIGLTVSNLYGFGLPLVERFTRNRFVMFGAYVVLAALAVFGGGEIGLRVLQLIGFDPGQMRAAVFQVGLVVVAVCAGFAVAFDQLKAKARASELREQEARQTALRAQLEALQARTDPHFLFNTLNTVAGLIEEDPRKAEVMLERMSSVFRYALAGAKTSWVRLEDELQAIGDYLEVEQVRFGERLRFTKRVAPECESILVPPLILQPLVENAVLHGVAPRTEGGSIALDVERHDGVLRLEVTDDGPGPGGSSHNGSGSSLDNLRERLELVYGGRAELSTGKGSLGGYRATLRLPVEERG